MSLKSARRLFDISTRLQVYVEGAKAGQTLQFSDTLRQVQDEFKKLLRDVSYERLDGLSKAQLNQLVVKLRKSQSAIYSPYTTKLLKQLQDFMQASLTVNRVAYAYAHQFAATGEAQVMSDKQASEYLEEQTKQNAFAAVFGLAAVLQGGAKLWSLIAAEPIAANGALVSPFLNAFSASAQMSLENIVRKGYANSLTPNQTIEEANAQLRKIAAQHEAVVATIMQHVVSNVAVGVASLVFEKYRWVSVIDSGTTDICRSRNGRVYRYGEGPMPPAHIRCRSHTVPYDRDYSDVTFYTWLREQSAEVQNAALGTRTAGMLRAGSLQSKDLVRLSNPPPISLDEFKKAAAIIATGEPRT